MKNLANKIIVSTVCFLPVYGHAALNTKKADTLPNVIVIFADDLGYGDLGCYGHPSIRTPNIDRMAAEGIRFTSFYVASSICSPSRASLLTGRLPVRTGVYGDRLPVFFPDAKNGLPLDEITIPEALKTKGYATACIGKWHLGSKPEYLPTNHGFDHYFGIPYSNDMGFEFSGKPRVYPPLPLLKDTTVIEKEPDQRFLTKRYTDEAVRFISDNRKKPFFLYLAHTFPHVPLYVSSKFEGKSPRGLYGDVVEELDWSVGEIISCLRKLKIDTNTLVVFTSDNGPWLTQNLNGGSSGLLKGGKWSTWEGGMRVPAIFWWPGTIKPGGVMNGIASTMDIFPTTLALAGIPTPSETILDGNNLFPILKGEKQTANEVFFYYRDSKLYAVRKGEWKAHFTTKMGFVKDGGPFEHDPPLLYNLNHDPSEQFDQAAKYPEIIGEIMKEVQKHKEKLVVTPSVIEN